MKKLLVLLCISLALQSHAQFYQKIHDRAILVDTHNDILTKIVMYGFDIDKDLTGKTHSDLARWKKAGWMCNSFQCGAMAIEKILSPMRLGKLIL
ncbi:MAG: hypothetical protein ABIP35_16070 [Ginsengibacter sp.]